MLLLARSVPMLHLATRWGLRISFKVLYSIDDNLLWIKWICYWYDISHHLSYSFASIGNAVFLPFIPFNGKAMLLFIARIPLPKVEYRPSIVHPRDRVRQQNTEES